MILASSPDDPSSNAELDAQVLALDARLDPPRLIPIAWAELSSLPKRRSLIGDLLDVAAMSVCYGGSGCGKTFFALDLAAHVALGCPWRGSKLTRGTVIYIAAEGGLGIEERLTAFRLHHDINVDDVPLHVIAESVDLCRSQDDTALLIERCAALSPVALIVIDTLSRVMSGGNENAPDDMGKFVSNCDRLRLATGAHVLVIHHTGKDDSRGARGHSLLRAAADTEIEVAKDEAFGIATAKVAKQRDHRVGATFAFRLVPVEIGHNEDGDPITSCVIAPAEASIMARTASRKLSDRQRLALDALDEATIAHGVAKPAGFDLPASIRNVAPLSAWREAMFVHGPLDRDAASPREDFRRLKNSLHARKLVGIRDDFVWKA